MKTTKQILSVKRIERIKEQGYTKQSDNVLCELAFGNRFAYRLCVSLLSIGMVFQSIPILALMMLIAFLGVVLPNHPFDYIYNHLLAKKMQKPKLPPRSNQLKFACAIATIWIGATIFLFYNSLFTPAYILGGMLIGVALLVSTVDLCIPSKIYNAIFNKMTKTA